MIDSKALVPLEKILFRDRPLLNQKFRLCPQCLDYNYVEVKICENCKLEVPNYTAEDFLKIRAKYLPSEEAAKGPTIGIGADLNPQMQDIEKKFEEHYAKWGVIYETALYVNRFTLKPLEMEEAGLAFLRNFPLAPPQIEFLKQYDRNFLENNYKSAVIVRKLLDIQRSDPTRLYKDIAYFLDNYTDELERDTMSANIFYLNVRYGYWRTPKNQVLQLDETNPVHQNEVLPYVVKLPQRPYEIEVALCPIHWKNLAEDRFHKDRKFKISKLRYRYLLENWFPAQAPDKAWHDLAYEWAKEKPELVETVRSYRDEQLALPLEQRDQNFLLSYMLIFDDFDDKILDFPWKYESYFAPLLSFHKDPDFVRSFFLEKADDEALMRGLYYYDFKNFPDQKALCDRVLKTFSKKQILERKRYLHPSLFALLAGYAMETQYFDIGLELLRMEADWPPLLKDYSLINLYKTNPDVVEKVVGMVVTFKNFPHQLITDLMLHITDNRRLGDSLVQTLRRAPEFIRFYPGIFDFWLQIEREDKDQQYATNIVMQLSNFINGKVQLSKKILENYFGVEGAATWTKKFQDIFVSANPVDQRALDRLIQFHVDLRDIPLDLFSEPSQTQQIVESVARILNANKYTGLGKVAEALALQLVQTDRLSPEQVQQLWNAANRPDDRYYATKMSMTMHAPIKKILEAEKAAKAAEQAAANQVKDQAKEQERQIQQERENKAAEERDRVIKKQQDKAQEFQQKTAELQMWYQTQVTTLMASQEDPAIKSAKITALAAEYQAKMTAAVALLNTPS